MLELRQFLLLFNCSATVYTYSVFTIIRSTLSLLFKDCNSHTVCISNRTSSLGTISQEGTGDVSLAHTGQCRIYMMCVCVCQGVFGKLDYRLLLHSTMYIHVPNVAGYESCSVPASSNPQNLQGSIYTNYSTSPLCRCAGNYWVLLETRLKVSADLCLLIHLPP